MISPIPLDGSPVEYYYPASCDIETGKPGNLLAVSLYTGSEYEVYFTWEDWLNRVIFLARKNKHMRQIWAHNGGNYDWQHLAEYITRERPDITMKMLLSGSSGIALQLTVPGMKQKIHLVDSFRLLPQALSKLSKDMGVETPKLDITGDKAEEMYNNNPALFHEYLRHDTIAVSEVLYKFWHVVNEYICIHNPVRELRMTIASMGMYIYRLEFLRKEIMIPWNSTLKDAERKTYHGGLVLSPKHGIYEDCTGVDINSSFPYIMASMELPDSNQVTKTLKYRPGKKGIYHIEYKTYDEDFPHIFNLEGNLSTRGEAWVTSIELEDIMEHGEARVIEGFTYDTTSPILKEYAERIFTLKASSKESGNTALAMVSKLLLNSLYGKFAQKEIGYTLISADTPGIMDRIEKADTNRRNGKRFEEIKLCGKFFLVGEYKYSNNSFVAIASFITAGARLRLINAVRANRENALYTDTDSLIVTGKPQGLPIGNKLGEWSVEFSGAEFILLGRKTYAAIRGDEVIKIRMKGVPQPKFSNPADKKAYQLDTIARMKLCVTDIEHTEKFSYTSPPTNKEVLLNGKKSALWVEKTRTIRATSDTANRAREGLKFTMDIPVPETKLQELCKIIKIELGGIAPHARGYLAEEYLTVPLYLRNKRGTKPDNAAEYLARNYPYLGVSDEMSLYDRLGEKAIYDTNHRQSKKRIPEYR